MKTALIMISILLSQASFALSERVIKREVREDINNGIIPGITYVDELNFEGCEDNKCSLSYSYEVSGCYWEQCYDLKCEGFISFDTDELLSEVESESCIDL